MTPFKTTITERIAELVIERPPVNALDDAGWHALADEIERLGERPDVSVIVIRAEGRGFCAGVDIKELDKHPEKIISVNAGNYRTFKAVHRNAVPVIAAVHGFVLGGGIGIAGSADIVVVQKVRMMYFTGEPITAAEAYRLGAVERVVPRAELREAALAIARKIAAKSPAMIRLAKESLNGIEDGNLEDKYRWEQGFTLQAYSEKDSAETRRAFVEKRDAKFEK
jgi:enoyl-CoA hydratase